MNRILKVTIVGWCLFAFVIPISAQDVLMKPIPQYTTFPKEEASFPVPVQGSLPEISMFKWVPVHLEYSEDYFLSEPLVWPRLDTSRSIVPRKQGDETVATHAAFRALYNKRKENEAKVIRQEWEKFFGTDVWFPYYKAKEVETWVKEKCSVRVFKFKGTPQFDKHQFLYTFNTRF